VRLTELGRRNEDGSRATSGRVRRGTESHESWPTWRQGGPPPICSREGADHKPGAADASQARRGRPRNLPSKDGRWRGDQVELREGFDRQPASQGAGPGGRFNNRVFEVQRRAPSSRRGCVVKGREARGAAERGHGQDAPFETRPAGRAGRGWRLAHESAREALGELGRCLTVVRVVL